MALTVDSFFNFFTGIYCDYDGALGDQCFDLANAYSRWIGGQRFTGATADLIFQQTGDFYNQISNQPDNFPIKGDVVVWNWPHVGIATGNNTDTNQFEVLEQNDPLNSNCHLKVYSDYNGVLGWLRPNSAIIAQPTAQPNFDEQNSLKALAEYRVDTARNLDGPEGNLEGLTRRLIDRDGKYSAQTTLVNVLQAQNTRLTATVNELTDKLNNSIPPTPTPSLPQLADFTLLQLLTEAGKRIIGR